MLFILFTVFLWILAGFHLWEHRRYEHDLRQYIDGQRGGDWRVCGEGVMGVALKRAFRVATRADMLRYAMPVIFLFVWLVVFRSWWPVALYVTVIVVKWFVAQTWVDVAQRRYTLVLAGYRLLSGRLD